MQTDFWGPHAWTFLHSVTFHYAAKGEPTPEDKARHKAFFNGLQHILPCGICQSSYALFVRDVPIDEFLASHYGLVYWLYMVHNLVNLKLGRAVKPFDKVLRFYLAKRAMCGDVSGMTPEQLAECRRRNEQVDEDTVNLYIQKAKAFEPAMCRHLRVFFDNNRDLKEKMYAFLCEKGK